MQQEFLILLAIVCLGQVFMSLLIAVAFMLTATYLAALRRRLEVSHQNTGHVGMISVTEYPQRPN